MRKVYPFSVLACLLLTLSASAQPKTPPPPAPHTDHRPILVCFGDSLTAGPGVGPGQSYPDYLQALLDQRHIRYRVDNQGISGNTTKDGVQRLPSVLALHPAVAVVEFGGNDGLRGLPIADTRANLDRSSPPCNTPASASPSPASPSRPTTAPTTSSNLTRPTPCSPKSTASPCFPSCSRTSTASLE